MCDAGLESSGPNQPSHPFEDTSVQASWTRTLGSTTPWDATPAILTSLPMDRNLEYDFFKTDIWHNFHLGLCKHFVGSAFVSAIERLDSFPVTAVDAKFAWFTADFAQFCRAKNINAFMKEISRETMSFPQSKTCPVGRWSKGVVATQFMKYLENYCDRFVINKTDDAVMLSVVFGHVEQVFYLCLICLLGYRFCGKMGVHHCLF
jgi:hypothetical protein